MTSEFRNLIILLTMAQNEGIGMSASSPVDFFFCFFLVIIVSEITRDICGLQLVFTLQLYAT